MLCKNAINKKHFAKAVKDFFNFRLLLITQNNCYDLTKILQFGDKLLNKQMMLNINI